MLFIGIGIIGLVISGIKRVFLHPLSHIPGSKISALTLWYEFYFDIVKKGSFIWKIQEMHKEYGPIVRINPKKLYVANKKLDKYEWRGKCTGTLGSIFVTPGHDHHRLRRAPLNAFLSARSVTQLEGQIMSKVQKLSDRFSGLVETNDVFRFDAAFMALTMDIIATYAFGKDSDYLDEADFEVIWRETLTGAATARENVESILAQEGEKKTARTIFHTLRDSNLPQEEKMVDRLCDEMSILPHVLDKLRDELDEAIPDTDKIPSWTSLQQLPYLNATVKEALRVSYGVSSRLPWIAHHDITYKQYVIPAGTPISCTTLFVLTDSSIFPEPETFRPERWIEAGKSLDKYLVAFNKGSRQCLGINLAYSELYLKIATLVRRFDWEMYETIRDDIVCKHNFMATVADLNSKGVRARITTKRD
ncbi:cytochrome P450 [Podospora fimiseda]|uniref:Cytochrome P450 n=1 Tax=Podospora fimiseda TaxID=252190 RepID=A0AAN7BG08_9PEZI|nr:cytochrome P450 [Podospora fimiseda]